MFDLDQRLSEWRTQLLESNVYSASDIGELEAHVLDVMDDLKTKGLTQEEAFWVAVHRIGDVEDLSREFSKVNRALLWRKRLVWLLAGYFFVWATEVALRTVPRLVFVLGSMAGAERAALSIANLIMSGCLMGGVLILLFSKKIWNSSVVSRITGMVRKHYIIFSISIPVFIIAGNMLSSIIALRTLSRSVVGQIELTGLYTFSAWRFILIASFFILVMLIRRSKSFAASRG